MRTFVKSIIPRPIWNWLGTKRREWLTRNDSALSTQEVFSRIYELGLWGSDSESTSGTGSHDPEAVRPYVETIGQWVSVNGGSNLSAVDLGCGDFNVGRHVHPMFRRYTAVDIVPSVIQAHQKNPQLAPVEFLCLNAIEDELPDGDVIFVRQVLQHLSNDQIARIIPKLRKFRHAIISEHLPSPAFLREKNLDKPHGGGIRLSKGSGVYLECPPFSLEALESTVLLEVPGGMPPDMNAVIRTTHYRFA